MSTDELREAVEEHHKKYRDFASVAGDCFKYKQLVQVRDQMSYRSSEADVAFQSVLVMITQNNYPIIHPVQWVKKGCGCFYINDQHVSSTWRSCPYYKDIIEFCVNNNMLFVRDADTDINMLIDIIDSLWVTNEQVPSFLKLFKSVHPDKKFEGHHIRNSRLIESAELLYVLSELDMMVIGGNNDTSFDIYTQKIDAMEKTGKNVKKVREFFLCRKMNTAASINKDSIEHGSKLEALALKIVGKEFN